jgi:uncharacterized protein (DUF433 family)
MQHHKSQRTVVRTSRGLSIAGTRITLYDNMDYVTAGWPPNLILHWFNFSHEQIDAIMAYIEAHRDEVESEYRDILDQADANRRHWEERNRERLATVAQLPPPPGYETVVAKLRVRKTELGLP